MVRLDEPFRGDIAALQGLLVDGPTAPRCRSRAVAQVSSGSGPNQILRENALRRIVVQCNTAGRDLGSVVADIQRVVGESVTLEPGYFIEYGGQFESQQTGDAADRPAVTDFDRPDVRRALRPLPIDPRLALQVMASIPLAIIGGVIAIFLSGGTLSVASLVGFITLAGISARNSIMMLSHYLHLMRYEGETFDEKMIVRGSLERLVPVLMTGLTTGLALIPLAFSGGVAGSEILQPVAIVILGGLVTVTLLDQIFTPALFYTFGCPPVLRSEASAEGGRRPGLLSRSALRPATAASCESVRRDRGAGADLAQRRHMCRSGDPAGPSVSRCRPASAVRRPR